MQLAVIFIGIPPLKYDLLLPEDEVHQRPRLSELARASSASCSSRRQCSLRASPRLVPSSRTAHGQPKVDKTKLQIHTIPSVPDKNKQ